MAISICYNKLLLLSLNGQPNRPRGSWSFDELPAGGSTWVILVDAALSQVGKQCFPDITQFSAITRCFDFRTYRYFLTERMAGRAHNYLRFSLLLVYLQQ
ncbi:MAG: hypothetical protein NZ660_02485 [Oscillatoriaceae bacterium SKYG93]|nr:hypothetical protein [Oscillatoriaceae bacterium SKYG93]MDW8452304.1 hypothetical protein [Oscillatoriaceae cyanobacterium SKYGB_i_bin93]